MAQPTKINLDSVRNKAINLLVIDTELCRGGTLESQSAVAVPFPGMALTSWPQYSPVPPPLPLAAVPPSSLAPFFFGIERKINVIEKQQLGTRGENFDTYRPPPTDKG